MTTNLQINFQLTFVESSTKTEKDCPTFSSIRKTLFNFKSIFSLFSQSAANQNIFVFICQKPFKNLLDRLNKKRQVFGIVLLLYYMQNMSEKLQINVFDCRTHETLAAMDRIGSIITIEKALDLSTPSLQLMLQCRHE